MGAPGILLRKINVRMINPIFSSPQNIPNTSLEIAIVGSDNIDTVLDDTVDETVICIGTLVVTLDSLESGVLGDTQGETVFRA
jgi:hypothetical protein